MKRSKLSIVLIIVFLFLLPRNSFGAYKKTDFYLEDLYKYSTTANLFKKEDAYEFVKQLTQDAFEGRKAGTPGGEKSAKWIAEQFKSWNLKPIDGDSYFQTVMIPRYLSPTQNVIGYIPASNHNIKESIVFGGHYDHLGIESRTGKIFRGANDNASGTAVMMESAKILSQSILASNLNIVFIAFAAEEEGLLGSTYYVNHPLFPVNQIKAMFNFDMVGTGTGQWEVGTNFDRTKYLNQIMMNSFKYFKGYYRLESWLTRPVSDHYPFYERNVPTLCMLKDNPTYIGGYHTTNDTLDKIDPKNLEACGKISILTALYIGKGFVIASFSVISQSTNLPVDPYCGMDRKKLILA